MSQFLGMLTNNRIMAVLLGALNYSHYPEQRSYNCYGCRFRKCRSTQSDSGCGRNYGCKHRNHHYSVDRFHESAGEMHFLYFSPPSQPRFSSESERFFFCLRRNRKPEPLVRYWWGLGMLFIGLDFYVRCNFALYRCSHFLRGISRSRK